MNHFTFLDLLLTIYISNNSFKNMVINAVYVFKLYIQMWYTVFFSNLDSPGILVTQILKVIWEASDHF